MANQQIKIQRFEDLKEWQKAREIIKMIYLATDKSAFRKDWALTTQMRRAAISMQSNIAEGFERARHREYVQFLTIAKASAAELRSQLYTALDLAYLDKTDFDAIYKELVYLSRMLNRHISYLKDYGKTEKAIR